MLSLSGEKGGMHGIENNEGRAGKRVDRAS